MSNFEPPHLFDRVKSAGELSLSKKSSFTMREDLSLLTISESKLRKSHTGPNSSYASARLASSVRNLSELPIVEKTKMGFQDTKKEIPTMFCCVNTPRDKQDKRARTELGRYNSSERAMEILVQDITPRPDTAVPRIFIRGMSHMEDPQEILSMRDGRVGSGWRHIKEISDIGNNKKLFIDGKVKEADNQICPPKIYSPNFITNNMLGLNTNISGYATYRKSVEPLLQQLELIDPPGASQGLLVTATVESNSIVKTNSETTLGSENVASENSLTVLKVLKAESDENETFLESKESRNQLNESANSNESKKKNFSKPNLNLDFEDIKKSIRILKKRRIRIENGSNDLTPCSTTRTNQFMLESNFTLIDTKLSKINTMINALKKNFAGSRYFDRVAENVTNCYDLGSKYLAIKEKHKKTLDELDHSTISLFRHTDQVFTLARSLNQPDDLRPSLVPIARDLNLVENILHFKFHDNFGKILLNNINFGRLVYVNDFGLVQKIKFFHLLSNSSENNHNTSDKSNSKKNKRIMRMLNLKNDI